MTTESEERSVRAEAVADKKRERDESIAAAMANVVVIAAARDVNTARLKALRLEKEQADAEAAKTAPVIKRVRRRKSLP